MPTKLNWIWLAEEQGWGCEKVGVKHNPKVSGVENWIVCYWEREPKKDKV